MLGKIRFFCCANESSRDLVSTRPFVVIGFDGSVNVCVFVTRDTLSWLSLSLSTSSSLAHCTSLSCITCQGTLSAVPCFVSSRALSIQSILLFMRDFRI